MSWKRSLMNGLTWALARVSASPNGEQGSPHSIFVLRNNDIGDLLVTTPLFEGLRRTFPSARIVAGVGRWNLPVLENNPYVDAVVEVNAPWHNKFEQPQGLLRAWQYIARSVEVKHLAAQQCAVGIDVLGSPFGSLLMMRARIPRRLGVRGYAGGETGVQQHVTFDPREHVGRSALRFAELLGLKDLPENRPQIFLRPDEIESAEARWRALETSSRKPRLLLGPGAGFAAKAWPLEKWRELIAVLRRDGDWNMTIVGGAHETELAAACAQNGKVMNLAGQTNLRETFALAAMSDGVVCHSSMLMHAAAAFRKPSVVLLGECFASATAHACQWGYPECAMLGRQSADDPLPSVLQALGVLKTVPLAA